jgi:glucose-6-phosphate dehydrogenase assembly protein OpcA
MAPDVTTIERITDTPIAVEPGGIESAFAEIWRKTAGAGTDESTIHLRVLNFVAVASDDDGARRFAEAMDTLPGRQPCRAILAVANAAAGAVQASISAHCWRSATGVRHSCSEEITLRGSQERPLASAVLALLVPELPVALWLIGSVTLESGLVRELLSAADRLFIDTAASGDVRRALRGARRACDEDDVTVVDLAWARMATWRGLVAQCFDGDDALRTLSRLQAIEITSGGAAPSSEALLFAGWLVSRLGLTIADLAPRADGIDATLYDASRGVRLSITASGEAGPLCEVRIRTEAATFLVQQHNESGHMHVRAEWPEAPVHRTVAQRPEDDASLIGQALDEADDGVVFEEAARAALALLGEADTPPTGSSGAPA